MPRPSAPGAPSSSVRSTLQGTGAKAATLRSLTFNVCIFFGFTIAMTDNVNVGRATTCAIVILYFK